MHSTPTAHRASAFLGGGGEAGARLRALDWSGHPVGPPRTWPACLRGAVEQVLASRVPMCLFVAPALVAIPNDGFRAACGWAPDALGAPLARLGGGAAGAALAPVLAGEAADVELGAARWRCSPAFDETGHVSGVLAVADPPRPPETERLPIGGRTWQISPDLIGILNADGYFDATNPAWESALGWSPEKMGSTFFLDFVHAEDKARTEAAWREAIHRRKPALHHENRVRARDGGWRWFSWVAVPEGDGIFCIGRDIEEEKGDAAALAQRTRERDILATVVETTDRFIQVLDMDFNFLAINQANVEEYARIYGWRPQAGDNLLERLRDRPEHARAVEAVWRRAMAGESFTVRQEFGDPTFARRHYEMKFEVLRDAQGRQVGAFMSGSDITVRVAEQQALAEAQEALRHAQKMEAVGQLTGGIAHDFNNLLAAIGGALQVLKMRVERGRLDGLQRYVDMGEASVRRAAALTQRLLAYSRRQVLEPRSIPLGRMLAEVAELVARTVGPGVQVATDLADAAWPIRADQSQLENALLNLCINARDAMAPGGGRLTISCRNQPVDAAEAGRLGLAPGDYVSLCVRDTGMGMPPQVLERIFEPFYTTKPPGHGTGLGLSMVYGFVRQSGGHVAVESEPGKGTRFCLLLPRGSEVREPAATAARRHVAHEGRAGRVLLVEDEANVRSLAGDFLRDAGYDVMEAENGAAALRALAAAPVDLLLTDVGLPDGMNGRDLAHRALDLRPSLRVLYMTGYADPKMLVLEGVDADTHVLHKPFDLADMLVRVRELLEEGAPVS